MAVVTLMSRAQRRRTACLPAPRPRWALAIPRPPRADGIAVPGLARDLRVKFATTPREWAEAFQLVTDNYQARGYERGQPGLLRFTSYHALPDTAVVVAKEAERVVATFSVVADNTLLGLPLEALYRAEVQELRRAGRRLMEITCLADRDLATLDFLRVFMTMIRLYCQHGLACGGDTNVITVNPRHRDFYARVLGYVPLGPRRAWAHVQGHPAEAFTIDRALMRLKAPHIHEQMFGQPLPADLLRPTPLPRALLRHFARNSSQTDPRLVDEILRYVDEQGSPRSW